MDIKISYISGGERLDSFLKFSFAEHSRTYLQQLISNGSVTVNGNSITKRHPLRLRDLISINFPPPRPALHIIKQDIPLDIVYEDDYVIVVNKPVGMVVHPGAGVPDGTLVNGLYHHVGDSLKGIGGVDRPGIVHRIDKNTSGLLVVAKDDHSHKHLSKQFRKHSVERTYDAFIWGLLRPTNGTIETQIARSRTNRQKMTVVEQNGKEAITHYRTLSVFAASISHIRCNLETGRTHQIRVHLSHKGMPIIGDETYSRKRKASKHSHDAIIMATQFKRQALHAATLGFIHPKTKELMRFEVPMPDDMANLLVELKTCI